MVKLNCWKFTKCGREPGGRHEHELGACPAAVETRADGINGGKNGGRACWAIAGTMCEGKVQGTFAVKLQDCRKCKFYLLVRKTEGVHWQNAKAIFAKLDSK